SFAARDVLFPAASITSMVFREIFPPHSCMIRRRGLFAPDDLPPSPIRIVIPSSPRFPLGCAWTRPLLRGALLGWCLWSAGRVSAQGIVINELNYNPPDNTVLVEFIELYNASAQAVALDGWRFDDGIDYTFPVGARIEPGAYLVIAAHPDA